jgi:hypothetical protein
MVNACVRPHSLTASTVSAAALDVRTRGALGADVRDCAEAMTCAVLARYSGVADTAGLRLAGANCAGGPILVQVNLRVCGAPARVQVAGHTPPQAVAAAAARLARQIRRLSATGEVWPWWSTRAGFRR